MLCRNKEPWYIGDFRLLLSTMVPGSSTHLLGQRRYCQRHSLGTAIARESIKQAPVAPITSSLNYTTGCTTSAEKRQSLVHKVQCLPPGSPRPRGPTYRNGERERNAHVTYKRTSRAIEPRDRAPMSGRPFAPSPRRDMMKSSSRSPATTKLYLSQQKQ